MGMNKILSLLKEELNKNLSNAHWAFSLSLMVTGLLLLYLSAVLLGKLINSLGFYGDRAAFVAFLVIWIAILWGAVHRRN